MPSTPRVRKFSQRTYNSPFPHDIEPITASKAISGTIYTLSGQPASGAIVLLIRESDNFLCKTGVTDALGHYVFPRDESDANTYFVIGYTNALFPQVHGMSDRGLIPS